MAQVAFEKTSVLRVHSFGALRSCNLLKMKYLLIAIILFLTDSLVQSDVSHLSLSNQNNNNQYLPPLPTKETIISNEIATDNEERPYINEMPKDITTISSTSSSRESTSNNAVQYQPERNQQQRFHRIESIQPSVSIASFSLQSETTSGVANIPLNSPSTYSYNRPAIQTIQQIQSQSILQKSLDSNNAYLPPPPPIGQTFTAPIETIVKGIQKPQIVLSAPEPIVPRQHQIYSNPESSSLSQKTTAEALPAPVTEIVLETEPVQTQIISEPIQQMEGFSHQQQQQQQQITGYNYQSPEQIMQPIQNSAPRATVHQTFTASAPVISSPQTPLPISYSVQAPVKEPVTYSIPPSAPLPLPYSVPAPAIVTYSAQARAPLPSQYSVAAPIKAPVTYSVPAPAPLPLPLHYSIPAPVTYSAPIPVPVTYSSKTAAVPSGIQQTIYSAQAPVIQKTLAPPIFQQNFNTKPQTLAGNYDYSTPNGQYSLPTEQQAISYSQPAWQGTAVYTPSILSAGSIQGAITSTNNLSSPSSSLSSLSGASFQEIGTQYASNGGYIY